MEYGWEDSVRYDTNLRRDAKKKAELTDFYLSQIRKSRFTKRIIYLLDPQNEEDTAIKAAYDYVNNLYPEASIKSVVALRAPQALLEECGYYGVGGFYDCRNRVIVISNCVYATENNEFDINIECTIDEVLCHEMIHYGANYDKPLSNRLLEEEIAYGKTAGYLRQKGKSDQFIIEKNMMPYLLSIVDREAVLRRVLLKEDVENIDTQTMSDDIIDNLRPKLAQEMIMAAIEIGKQIIGTYYPIAEKVTNYEFSGKRKLILDDI